MKIEWLPRLHRAGGARGVLLVTIFVLLRLLWRHRAMVLALTGFLAVGLAMLLRPQGRIPADAKPPSGHSLMEKDNQGKASPFYTVTDLGTLGGKGSGASAINNKGEVVGTAHTADTGRAYLWRDGKMRDLGALGGIGSQASDVNDKSQVVGVSKARAFLWQDGKMQDLGALPGGKYSYANAINNKEQVVGSAGVGQGAYAVLWHNGKIKNLGRLPQAEYSLALSINNKGQVVGYGHGGEYFGNFAIPRAFLWDQKNGMREIGTLGGGQYYDDSFAHAINDKEQIVGVSNWHAFLWQNGTMQDLGVLPGYQRSHANAINNKGQVVGIVTKSVGGTPFLWQEGVMYDLNTLIPSDSGWKLSGAYGINDAGQIAGGGRHDGEVHAFLLTPARR